MEYLLKNERGTCGQFPYRFSRRPAIACDRSAECTKSIMTATNRARQMDSESSINGGMPTCIIREMSTLQTSICNRPDPLSFVIRYLFLTSLRHSPSSILRFSRCLAHISDLCLIARQILTAFLINVNDK